MTAPDDPRAEQALDRTLCDSEGGFIPAVTDVTSQDELCRMLGTAGGEFLGCFGGVSFDTSTRPCQEEPGCFDDRGGEAWVPLESRLVREGRGSRGCVASDDLPAGAPCLQLVAGGAEQEFGAAHLVWEVYDGVRDVEASNLGVVQVGPGDDFSSPLLDLGASRITINASDPLRPFAAVQLFVDRPVTGSLVAIPVVRGCPLAVLPRLLPPGGPANVYRVQTSELCPGAAYRFLVQLSEIGPDDPPTTYYALSAQDWPADEGAEYRIWPGASARTPNIQVDLDVTARVVGIDDDRVYFDRFDVAVGRLPLARTVPDCGQPGDERSFSITGLGLRSVVPVEVSLDVSTHPQCGHDTRGHVASVRGLVEVPLLDLVEGRVQELIIPDRGAGARVIVTFDDVTFSVAAPAAP